MSIFEIVCVVIFYLIVTLCIVSLSRMSGWSGTKSWLFGLFWLIALPVVSLCWMVILIYLTGYYAVTGRDLSERDKDDDAKANS